MDMKIELVAIPVTDTDRAIDFYVNKVGFHLDHDHRVGNDLRFVQLTPPGSACSIVLGEGITDMTPGSQKGVQMVVTSAQQAHDELAGRGAPVGDVQSMPWGAFVFFSDPDGNTWALQELPDRSAGQG